MTLTHRSEQPCIWPSSHGPCTHTQLARIPSVKCTNTSPVRIPSSGRHPVRRSHRPLSAKHAHRLPRHRTRRPDAACRPQDPCRPPRDRPRPVATRRGARHGARRGSSENNAAGTRTELSYAASGNARGVRLALTQRCCTQAASPCRPLCPEARTHAGQRTARAVLLTGRDGSMGRALGARRG